MLFETIEVLSGYVPKRFTIPNGFALSGWKQGVGSLETDFDSHRDLSFWDENNARQWNSADCNMYPTFSVGNSYLLFLGAPHWKAYEAVKSEDDLWLQTVRNIIAQP